MTVGVNVVFGWDVGLGVGRLVGASAAEEVAVPTLAGVPSSPPEPQPAEDNRESRKKRAAKEERITVLEDQTKMADGS